MKSETASEAERPERVARNGRRYFSAEHKRRVVEQCLQPGASVSGIALAHGFNANLVRKWLQAHQRHSARQGRQGRALVPVSVRDAPTARPAAVRRAQAAKSVDSTRLRIRSTIEIRIGAARLMLRDALNQDGLRLLIDTLLAPRR